MADDAPSVLVHQFGCGFVAHDLAAAADMDLGAKLEKAGSHRLAEAGAASGHQNAPSGEKLTPFVRWEHYDMGASYAGIPQGFTPVPTGLASDGKPRFDLGQFNPAYFDRLHTRAMAARDRGIW